MPNMPAASDTAGLASHPDPQPDRPGTAMPANIGFLLYIVRILADYGRHLSATLEHRAVARGFSIIAQCFGTANVVVILAHLYRGIMRAVALERILLARAARGRDLAVHGARDRRKPQPPARAGTEPPAPPEPPARTPAPPRGWRTGPDEPLDLAHLPSMAEIEAEVHRRPPGCVIADICQDLGVRPWLCSGSFWNELFDGLRCFGGNLARYYSEMRQREVRFEKELDRNPALGWPEQTPDAIRRVLGFFVGEVPVDPCPAMAAACGPAAARRPP